MSAIDATPNHLNVRLYQIAHGRTGDKGDRCNISVVAFSTEIYEVLVEQVTADAVRGVFSHRRPGTISRYLLPRLNAMNFVIDGVLDGGVNDSLNLDSHGKSLAGFLLDLPINLPAHLASKLRGVAQPDSASCETEMR